MTVIKLIEGIAAAALCVALANDQAERLAGGVGKRAENPATTIIKPTSVLQAAPSGQVRVQFNNAAGGQRSFFISLPPDYDSRKTYKLLLVFPGTNTSGKEMFEYVGQSWSGVSGIEENMKDTIFVYPDPRWRYFPAWNERFAGWLLGPYGGGAAGHEDIEFVAELIDWLGRHFTIDTQRVFATGHSWGGDMTAVVGCFLGHRFRAIAPVAANRPYWFQPERGRPFSCTGDVAVWTFFGKSDEHFFGQEAYAGEFGVLQNEFWRSRLGCRRNDPMILPVGKREESVEYRGCRRPVRFTLYRPDFSGESDKPGHQPPDFYRKAISDWFSSF